MNKDRVYSICGSCAGCHIDKCIWVRSGGSRAPEGAIITWRKYNVGNGNGVRACLYGCIEDCPEYRKEDPKTRTRWSPGAASDLMVAIANRWIKDYRGALLAGDGPATAAYESEFRRGILGTVYSDPDRMLQRIKEKITGGVNNGENYHG